MQEVTVRTIVPHCHLQQGSDNATGTAVLKQLHATAAPDWFLWSSPHHHALLLQLLAAPGPSDQTWLRSPAASPVSSHASSPLLLQQLVALLLRQEVLGRGYQGGLGTSNLRTTATSNSMSHGNTLESSRCGLKTAGGGSPTRGTSSRALRIRATWRFKSSEIVLCWLAAGMSCHHHTPVRLGNSNLEILKDVILQLLGC